MINHQLKLISIFWIPFILKFCFAISWFHLQHVTASQINKQWSELIHIEHPLLNAAGHVHAYPCGVCQECADHMSEGIFFVVGCCAPNIALWLSRRGDCFFSTQWPTGSSVNVVLVTYVMNFLYCVVSCEVSRHEVRFDITYFRSSTSGPPPSPGLCPNCFLRYMHFVTQLWWLCSLCMCEAQKPYVGVHVHVYLLMYIRPVMSGTISRPDLKFMYMLHILSFWDVMRWVCTTITTNGKQKNNTLKYIKYYDYDYDINMK